MNINKCFAAPRIGFRPSDVRRRAHAPLRHTFASWWVQSGGDLYKLSRVLGHRTLQMSARYGHLRTDDLHEEMRKVEGRRG